MLALRRERIVLRDFVEADLDLYAHWLGPDHEWRRWDGPYFPPPAEIDIRRRIDRLDHQIRNDDWPKPRQHLVVADGESNRLLGTVARYWICKTTFWLGVGIDLYDPEVWGRGLGGEALEAWCTYLFDVDPRLCRLDLQTWSGNKRMMRLAERLGFALEARHRDARSWEGRRYDALGYGVLREEWAQRSL